MNNQKPTENRWSCSYFLNTHPFTHIRAALTTPIIEASFFFCNRWIQKSTIGQNEENKVLWGILPNWYICKTTLYLRVGYNHGRGGGKIVRLRDPGWLMTQVWSPNPHDRRRKLIYISCSLTSGLCQRHQPTINKSKKFKISYIFVEDSLHSLENSAFEMKLHKDNHSDKNPYSPAYSRE